MALVLFIFSSFWVWLGFIILIYTVFSGAAEVVRACKRNRKVTTYRVGNSWRMEIENASDGDVVSAELSGRKE